MHDCSILVPVYCTTEESLDWLGECLESASIQDCEVVVSDDGSLLSIDKILSRFRNLVVVRQPHTGVSHARNTAALAATNSLIIPLDCDDRFVEGAICRLLSIYDGTIPVYPDVRKFGLVDEPHYALLDFSCENIYKHVGFSSVNVLHRKDQWKSIGGWDEKIDFYEDGEYNARLFSTYCGKRFPEPLVEYRIHGSQRTKQYQKQSGYYAKSILKMIRSYNMACKSCGKNRSLRTVAQTLPVASAKKAVADVATMPGEVGGRILAQYVGGMGRAKHYYRGLSTKFPYKVMHGDYTYVDPKDAGDATDMNNKSLFIKVVQKAPAKVEAAPAVQPQAEPQTEPQTELVADAPIVRSARKDAPSKTPLVDDMPIADVPDIYNMSVKEIENMDAIPVDIAKKLLLAEQNGKNRTRVITFLKRAIAG